MILYAFIAVVLMVDSCPSNALSPSVTNALFCPDPGTPDNARRDDSQTLLLPGVKVTFYCDFTFKLIGPKSRTCLQNGTWSDKQPTCKKYMCDELDALPPKNGKRFGEKFTIGSEVRFRCSSNYILVGKRRLACKSDGHWSSQPPTCQHRCANHYCKVGMICKLKNRKPTCVCRDNMQCTSIWDPVCGSDGISYNNECIMKATACRNGQDIQTVKHDRCAPGDRCNIYPVSDCRASFSVYFYDIVSGRCKHMIAGGCHPSGWNGFFNVDECKKYCEQDVCVLKPEPGPCNDQKQRWYYDSQTKKCAVFKYGGCFGNANNFRSLNDCQRRCI